jgi:hypothetical protein
LTTSPLDKAAHARDGSELRGFSAANAGIFGENALLALQSHSRAIHLHGFWIEKGDSSFNDWRHDGFFEARENSEGLVRSGYHALLLSLDATDSRFHGYDEFRSSGGW